jgi:SH3-like domain-containing protein
MSRRSLRAALLLALPLAFATAGAGAAGADFRSLAEPAILYDGPSKQAKPLYIIQRLTPVEVITTADRWAKVREPAGNLLWLERRQLADKRTVIISAARSEIRQKPDASSALVFEAARDVVLELIDKPADGWVKVRHRDGASGYVRVSQIWGL